MYKTPALALSYTQLTIHRVANMNLSCWTANSLVLYLVQAQLLSESSDGQVEIPTFASSLSTTISIQTPSDLGTRDPLSADLSVFEKLNSLLIADISQAFTLTATTASKSIPAETSIPSSPPVTCPASSGFSVDCSDCPGGYGSCSPLGTSGFMAICRCDEPCGSTVCSKDNA